MAGSCDREGWSAIPIRLSEPCWDLAFTSGMTARRSVDDRTGATESMVLANREDSWH